MEQFRVLSSHVVALPNENIDTDQIIPARYLKTIAKAGLGAHLFADWRYHADGSPDPDFPLNHPAAEGARILLTGDNFGCGSSREHAPWALMDHGFRAIISTSFADIFRNNALKNGLLPVEIDRETHHQLCTLVAEEPLMQLTVDLMAQTMALPDGRRVPFEIDGFSKASLLEGLDQLGYLQQHEPRVTEFERDHPARVNTRPVNLT